MDLTKIKEIAKKPVALLIAGAVVGLILGLIIGWGIWPVQWTDASAENLRPDLQRSFLRGAILAYDRTNDQTLALNAWQDLGANAEITLQELPNDLGYLTTEQVLKFSQIVNAENVVIPPVVGDTLPDPEAKPANSLGKNILIYGLILIGVLAVGAVLVYFFFSRKNVTTKSEPMATWQHEKETFADLQAQKNSAAIPGQEKPVAQFITTYMFGDDMYDDSFSIESAGGEFLGECGVGVSDTIGVGDPKKMSAIEVWLFDKNDVQTVTKVFMSEHVFDDQATLQKLESKGELVLAEPGKQILLETATLQLEARIVDMSYGELPLPPHSYFQRFTLELSAWAK